MPRRRDIGQLPHGIMIAALAIAVGLAAFLFITLRRDQTAEDTAADRAFRSALLPDDWSTYGGDNWSVGYPSEWDVTITDDIVFHPTDAPQEKIHDYFSVEKPAKDLETVLELYDTRGDVTERSEFLFAGYETVKYAIASGGTFYVIDYQGEDVYIIGTFKNDDADIGIMLATFKFLY